MTVRIEPLSDELAPAWDAFVEACPQATFFHRAGWKSVIDRSFGHPTYFVCARRGNEVVGVLPLVHVKSMLFGNALISNAFCVAGGPVASDDEALSHLIAYAAKTLESVGADYVELRDLAVCPPGWKRRAATHATFARDIAADEAANLKQIPRKQRAVVRKAIANDNLTFDLQDDLKTFYGLFALSMRNHGTPVLPRRYLENLRSVFGSSCEILTVRHNGVAVSSVLSFYFRDTVLPYYTGASPDARRLGANDLMYWRVMRQAADRGCSRFDFGRSRLGSGPYSFKKNWGFEPRAVSHDYLVRDGKPLPHLNPENPKYAMFVQLWQRLPLPLANAIGPAIVRSLG